MEEKAIRHNRKFIHLSIWGSLLIVFTLLLFDSDMNVFLFVTTTLLLTLLSAGTIYRTWFTLIPKYLDNERGLKFSLVLLSWLLFDALVLLQYLGLVVGFMRDITVEDLPGLAGNGWILTMFMWIIIIAWTMIIIGKTRNEAQLKAAQLQQQLAESEGQRKQLELAQLKAQLQPHFLFNTLNTIYGAAIKKSDETPAMIMELSDMLDYGLYQASKDRVPLIDEIKHLERYLSLEQQRFRDGLIIEFDIHIESSAHAVPPLLLMPLVENAVKHGKQVEGELNVRMSLTVEETWLRFEVSNPFQANEEAKGIGLKNLQKRLQHLYPDNHRLIIEEKGDIFSATLRIPLN